ncbi:MAG: imidazole glycerol phosphate synthase subunit HisH [Elusimicrobia bacterium]|nr:imidazole glycerol phosphate synthase subunit HisH [Elusimicrobiota bacterium]
MVTVVDYGRGNLYSISQALRHLGCEARITSDLAAIEAAERMILPGVGAFADGMEGLRARKLVGPLKAYCASGRPLLGICLGMQLLMDESEEFGTHPGLGIVPGRVTRLPQVAGYKVPHVGWSPLVPASPWKGTALADLGEKPFMYFVHSYAVAPSRPADRLAMTPYAEGEFCSVLKSANVSGCQFHPEKSAAPGLKILANFVRNLQESAR